MTEPSSSTFFGFPLDIPAEIVIVLRPNSNKMATIMRISKLLIVILITGLMSPAFASAQTSEVLPLSDLKAAAYFKEGVDLWHSGQKESAIRAWEDAVRLDPNLAEAHYNLGVALRDQKTLSREENCLKQIDSLQCLMAKNHLSYGPSTELEKALRALKEATRLNPDHPNAVYMQGVIEGQLDRYDQAQASFAQHLENNPNDMKGHYLMCVTYRARGEYEKALAACKRAIVEDRNHIEAHHTLGMIYLTQQRSDDALGAFTEVIRLQPRSQAGWFNLGLAQSGRGHYIEAIDAYKRALDVGPANGAINLNLGKIYDELEKGSQAIDFTRTARHLYSEKKEWRQVAKADENLTRFMKKYWGLPDNRPFYLD